MSREQHNNHNTDKSSPSELDLEVYWFDGLIDSQRVSAKKQKTIGFGADIELPQNAISEKWELIKFDKEVVINVKQSMNPKIIMRDSVAVLTTTQHVLSNDQIIKLDFNNNISVKIKFAADTPPVVLASPALISATEFFTIIGSVVLSLLLAWIITVKSRNLVSKEGELENRQAEVIFTKLIKPSENEIPIQARPTENQNLPNKANNSSKEVAVAEPKPRDIKKTGLLAAFGANTRTNLQQVAEGSKELIGAGGKTKTAAGTTFGSGGVSDSIESQIKDTGAGRGNGSTFGIAGVGTKGRSSGNGGYGVVGGIGGKDSVQISAGGNGESFAGTIDKEAVRRAVRSALLQIKSCYEREYRKDSSLTGKVVVSWEIHAGGVGKNARIISDKSTLRNATVEECVKNRILELRFPEPPIGAAAEVTYPFIFIPEK